MPPRSQDVFCIPSTASIGNTLHCRRPAPPLIRAYASGCCATRTLFSRHPHAIYTSHSIVLTSGAQVPAPLQDEDDKAAAAGAGGSPSAPSVTPAPPSIEAINAFSIPPLDLSQDETGVYVVKSQPQTCVYFLIQGLSSATPGSQHCEVRNKECVRRGVSWGG